MFFFLLLSPVLVPLIGVIVRAVLWLICLPFKAIGAVFKGISKRREERQRLKREKAYEEAWDAYEETEYDLGDFEDYDGEYWL